MRVKGVMLNPLSVEYRHSDKYLIYINLNDYTLIRI